MTRTQQLYELLARRDGDPTPYARVSAACHACLRLLPAVGAGVMLMAAGDHHGTLYATDDTIQTLEDLQHAAGEGPCVDAHNLGRPVFEPDLATNGPRRWPTLGPAVVDAGMAAIFAFPLQVDGISVGALDLYARRPAPLTAGQAYDGWLLAAMIGREVMAMQADAPAGSLPDEVPDLTDGRVVFEQATGVIVAQLETDVADAARRLREHARLSDRALADVAADVVAHRLRLG